MSHDLDPGATPPEGSPTGGLPPDFFEKPGRAEAAADAAARPSPRAASGGPSGRARVRPILLMIGVVLLGSAVLFLCGVLTGWSLAHKGASPPPRDYSPPATPSAALVARAIAEKASKAEVRDVGAEVEENARRVEQLRKAFEARPAPPPAPDLGPLRARVDDLAKASERLDGLPDGLQAVGGRVGALEKGLESLRGEIASLQEAVKQLAARPPPEPVDPAREANEAAQKAVDRGVGLFKAGDYARAREAALKQAEATPDDARLWYLAALANGFVTGDWRGETERLVKRGVERERAGTPAPAEVDALFGGLPENQGGRWLRDWRARAARP